MNILREKVGKHIKAGKLIVILCRPVQFVFCFCFFKGKVRTRKSENGCVFVRVRTKEVERMI